MSDWIPWEIAPQNPFFRHRGDQHYAYPFKTSFKEKQRRLKVREHAFLYRIDMNRVFGICRPLTRSPLDFAGLGVLASVVH